MRVRIAVCTYRRPEALASALASVRREIDSARDIRVDLLVVDNDPQASGRAAAAGCAYVVEEQPGIAAARNRALRESSEHDVLIFIDDDETVDSGWLGALWRMYETTRCTAVAGRVVTHFPDDTDAWVLASGAFIRPTRTHGAVIAEAATNNLLLDLAEIRRLGLAFDERFGLTGGSDSLFTRQLTRRGGTIRWADDAVVTEQEEAARLTRRWVLARTFRFGNTGVRVERVLAETPFELLRANVRGVARGLLRVAGGSARVTLGFVTGSLRRRATGERTLWRGMGMLAAVVGHAHDEYGARRKLQS